jgi:hypothetical protein
MELTEILTTVNKLIDFNKNNEKHAQLNPHLIFQIIK